ncbi:acyltransferase family protein [Sphingomonas montanisoli]|nr:acyltransferase [Sphingomonas montanisoli]
MDAIPMPDWTKKRTPMPAVSDAIGLSRLICILGVVYVHAWTGLGGDKMTALAGSGQDVLRWSLVELFGRSAVPLLSIISGWLVAGSVTKRSYRVFVGGKTRAILLPMLLWNAIAIVLVVGAGALRIVPAPLLGDLRWVLDNMLELTRAGDINVQMGFLRDLFLCMLIAPVIARWPTSALASVAVLSGIYMISEYNAPILLRPSILMFFTLGIIARRHGWAERLAILPWWQAALPFAILVVPKTLLSIWGHGSADYHRFLLASTDLALRAAAALLVWRCAIALAQTAAGRRALVLERYAFFLFCSHLIFMWLIGPAIGDLTGPMGSRWWPAYFILQPLLALGFAIGLAQAIVAVSPKVAETLSGGRIGGRRQATSPAARPLAQAH